MEPPPRPADPPAPDGPATPTRDPELARAVDRFVESLPSPRTRVLYRGMIADFLRAGKIATWADLAAVEPADVVRYRNALQRRGLAAGTINGRLAAMRGLWGRLQIEGQIARNPGDPRLVRGLPTSDLSRTEGLAVDEVRALLATCDGTLRGLRDRALVLALYYQGLRRSEASKLNYRDLTTKRGLLIIRDAKRTPYNEIRLRPDVRRAIEDYLEVLNRELRRRATRPQDPVFVSLSPIRSWGRRLAPSSVNNIVKDRAQRAGIGRRVTAHVLRHACTTHALGAGVALHQVQRHLRHKDVRTTLRYDRDRDVRKNPTSEALPSISTE